MKILLLQAVSAEQHFLCRHLWALLSKMLKRVLILQAAVTVLCFFFLWTSLISNNLSCRILEHSLALNSKEKWHCSVERVAVRESYNISFIWKSFSSKERKRLGLIGGVWVSALCIGCWSGLLWPELVQAHTHQPQLLLTPPTLVLPVETLMLSLRLYLMVAVVVFFTFRSRSFIFTR